MSFVKQQEACKKLKVIGAGLMGTGTASLKLALDELRMAPCYHAVMLQSSRLPGSGWTYLTAVEKESRRF